MRLHLLGCGSVGRASNGGTRVAALYVEKGGVYYGLDGVDPWDEERDARTYAGPYPVVAHPPCARWSRLAGFTEARFGYKRGEDGGCFKAALEAVRTWGGVLEHPAFSSAWDAFNLPEPIWKGGWNLGLDGGASCYVEQGRYGLPVKKATWLYACGVELPELCWGYTPDGEGDAANQNEWGGIDAWRDHSGGHRAASSTPLEFRDVLLAMARTAHVAVSA